MEQKTAMTDTETENYTKSPARLISATFLPHMSGSVAQGFVGPLAPLIQQAFNISRAQIGSLTSAYSIGMIVMAVAAGSIIERSSLRLWMSLCPALSGLLVLAFTRIISLWQGLVLFAVLGIIFSFVNPATTKAILVGFPRERRGTALGIKQTGIPAGVLLVSAALPAIAVALGWRESLVYAAFFNIALGVLVWFLYNEKEIPPPQQQGLNRREIMRNDVRKLMRDKNFLIISFLQGIFTIGHFITRTYMALFLVEAAGYSVIHAGLVLSVANFGGMISRVLWGMMSDFAFGGRRIPVLIIIGCSTVLSVLGFAMVNASTPAWIVWTLSTLAGAGTIGFGGVAILLRAELAGKRLAATATGIGMSISQTGVVLGTPIFGLLVDATGTYRLSWLLLAVICLAATLMLRLVDEGTALPQESSLSE